MSEVLVRLIDQLQPWWEAIYYVGMMLGIVLVVAGLTGAVAASRRHEGVSKTAAGGVVGGILLANLISTLDMFSYTVFGKASATGLGYVPSAVGPEKVYIQFTVIVVMLVGMAGVIKGGFLMKASTVDSRHIGHAVTHLVGGSMAVNIVPLVELLGVSVGGPFESAITKFL